MSQKDDLWSNGVTDLWSQVQDLEKERKSKIKTPAYRSAKHRLKKQWEQKMEEEALRTPSNDRPAAAVAGLTPAQNAVLGRLDSLGDITKTNIEGRNRAQVREMTRVLLFPD